LHEFRAGFLFHFRLFSHSRGSTANSSADVATQLEKPRQVRRRLRWSEEGEEKKRNFATEKIGGKKSFKSESEMRLKRKCRRQK
jgi:hypothetical protein